MGAWAERLLTSRSLVAAVVAIGIVLRVAQYASNRSLWADEAWLALNLVHRSFGALTGSLSFNQAAPVGFLLTEGVVGRIFGYSEYALRAFPLVSGLAALPVFAWLARRVLPLAVAPFAVLLFAVSDGLVYYSSELKPYGIDAFAAVVLLAAGVVLLDDRRSRTRPMLVAGAVSVAVLPFSFPAALVALSVAAAVVLGVIIERRPNGLRSVAIAGACALVAVALALFGASRVSHVRSSFEGSAGRFLGVSGSSSPLHAINVLGTDLAAALGLPQGRPYNQVEKLALVCMLIGALALVRRNWKHACMLLLPFALVFVASAAHAYPLLLRTLLFLLPAVALLIAEGVAVLVRRAPRRLGVAAAVAVLGLLSAGPVSLAATHLVHPRKHEEIKPVIEYVRRHWRQGDVLYVHFGAQYALLYYTECGCLDLTRPGTTRPLWPLHPLAGGATQESPAALSESPTVIVGRYLGDTPRPYLADLDRVRHARRVWFLYTHLSGSGQVAVLDAMLRDLPRLGRRVGGIDRRGAHAYLFRLRH